MVIQITCTDERLFLQALFNGKNKLLMLLNHISYVLLFGVSIYKHFRYKVKTPAGLGTVRVKRDHTAAVDRCTVKFRRRHKKAVNLYSK